MKLIFCPECWDVVKLAVSAERKCECGKSYGRYKEDRLNAYIGGLAIPLGFANPSLVAALDEQPEKGPGRRFEAFVIEKNCPTIEVKA